MNTAMGVDRPRFRPTLWSTVAASVVFAVLVGLGSWQVHRLQWKEELIAHREARLAAPPVLIGKAAGQEDDLAFRRASATGRFLHSFEFRVTGRVHRGQAGFDIVTPLRIGPADHVLVNRGWVPMERADPATRQDGQISTDVTVTGLLRKPGKNNRWIPDNDPLKGVWHYVDPKAMAEISGLAGMRAAILIANAAPNPGGLPVGRAPGLRISNRHLGYAITWYGLALVLAVIYFVFHWRREDPSHEPG